MVNNENVITACNCGSVEFFITEELTYSGYLKNGILMCKNKDCETISINCSKCNKKFNYSNFNEIEYD